MGDRNFHISKAERNEQFYRGLALANLNFPEWGVVALFYICLHYVDAVLSEAPDLPLQLRNPQTHAERNRAISRCSTLAQVSVMYMNLYDRCRDARYVKLGFNTEHLDNLENRVFHPLRSHLRKCLALPNR